MTTIEPRLAERRKGVSEDRARGRLKWVLITIVFLLAVVGGIWLVRSPILSIKTVTVTGAEMSNPSAVVSELAMGQGTPTIDVDASVIESAILEDPWVQKATVTISWPGSLTIAVVEYRPFASVRASDGWVQVAVDGSVLVVAPPLDSAPIVEIDTGPVPPGYKITNPLILGALAFAQALPPDLAQGISIATDGEGLVVMLEGHEVTLGRPVEMTEKAIVLVSLIASGLEPGSHINLIAPLRPAVTNPQPQLEAEE